MEKNVVTGQQLGLLGGPLYTTYKVLGAIHFAREIDGNHIYWLESNDADFSEINHIDYIDAAGDLRTLTWDIDSQGYSCGLIEVDTYLVELLNEFFDSLRQTEFTPALKALALRCYIPGFPLRKASCRLAKELFGHFGIELFDPSQKCFKDFMYAFLLREAEHTPPGEQCNLFCMMGKKRMAVFKTETGGYRLRDGTPVNPALHDLVPNVKTRNVCQDAYFDTHTYVAGPGEVKYIKELGPIYEFHGVKKADVIPRMSITLLEPRAMRALKKYEMTLQEVFKLEKTELLQKVIKANTGFDYKELSLKSKQVTQKYVNTLKEMGIDLGKTERHLYQAIKDNLGEKRAQEKSNLERILKVVGNLSDLIVPFGKKQERVFNIFYYMNLYGGLSFIDWLYERYDPSLTICECREPTENILEVKP